jgi:hypothetical protein
MLDGTQNEIDPEIEANHDDAADAEERLTLEMPSELRAGYVSGGGRDW